MRCAPETSKADDEPHDKPATTRDWRPGVRSAEQPGTDAEILEPGDDVAHECEVISLSHTGNVPATNHDCVCARYRWHHARPGAVGHRDSRGRSAAGVSDDVDDDIADAADLAMPAPDQVGDQAGPAGLMGGTEAGPVVAVEVLIE